MDPVCPLQSPEGVSAERVCPSRTGQCFAADAASGCSWLCGFLSASGTMASSLVTFFVIRPPKQFYPRLVAECVMSHFTSFCPPHSNLGVQAQPEKQGHRGPAQLTFLHSCFCSYHPIPPFSPQSHILASRGRKSLSRSSNPG